MGERKWAWDALYEVHRTPNREGDELWRAERYVESAVISEFISDVYEATAELTQMTEECGQHGVMLGIQLALREMRKLSDERSM